MEISTIGLQLLHFGFSNIGYKDVRLINGGRKKWLIEDRSTTTDIPQYPKGNFRAASHSDNSIRAFLSYLRPYIPGSENRGGSNNIVELVDVRSPKMGLSLYAVHILLTY
jgi:thiosulfate/3-mercaptopyruvate sulfurtransferase